MELTGQNIIGNQYSGNGDIIFTAVNPSIGKEIPPDFKEATLGEINKAAEKAAAAFQEYRKTNVKTRIQGIGRTVWTATATGVFGKGGRGWIRFGMGQRSFPALATQ